MPSIQGILTTAKALPTAEEKQKFDLDRGQPNFMKKWFFTKTKQQAVINEKYYKKKYKYQSATGEGGKGSLFFFKSQLT